MSKDQTLYQEFESDLEKHRLEQAQNKEKAVAITHSSLHDLPSEINPRACFSQGEQEVMKAWINKQKNFGIPDEEIAKNIQIVTQDHEKKYVFGVNSDEKGEPLPAAYAYAMKIKGASFLTYDGENPVFITDALHFKKNEQNEYRIYEDKKENGKPVLDAKGEPVRAEFEGGHVYIVREGVENFRPQKDQNGQITEWITERKIKFSEDRKATPQTAMELGVQIMVIQGSPEQIKQRWNELYSTYTHLPYQLQSEEGKGLKNWLEESMKSGDVLHVNKEYEKDKEAQKRLEDVREKLSSKQEKTKGRRTQTLHVHASIIKYQSAKSLRTFKR